MDIYLHNNISCHITISIISVFITYTVILTRVQLFYNNEAIKYSIQCHNWLYSMVALIYCRKLIESTLNTSEDFDCTTA